MPLPKYAELPTFHRGEPCAEYPGNYYLYYEGEEIDTFPGEVGERAAQLALRTTVTQDGRQGRFSLAWEASDNDPRIGEVWFTGFYTLTNLQG